MKRNGYIKAEITNSDSEKFIANAEIHQVTMPEAIGLAASLVTEIIKPNQLTEFNQVCLDIFRRKGAFNDTKSTKK